MPTVINVDGLEFEFPDGWSVSKYDEWVFYRKHFQSVSTGIKGVDLIAVSEGTAYLIEVKDYSRPGTTKPSQLPQSVATKVLHTLAAMLPAKLNANDRDEVALASALLKATSLKVILHLDNPKTKPHLVDPADLKQKLKSLLKAVDPRVTVSSRQSQGHLPWSVS